MLILTEDDVDELLRSIDLVTPLRAALRAVSAEEASVPPRVAAMSPLGMLGAMPGYVPGLGMAAKLVTYFRANHELGLPGHQAVVVLADPDDGRLLALMGGTRITAVRTAVSAAVAAQALAPSTVDVVAVVGTGVQARSHLDAFAQAFPRAGLRLAGRSQDRAHALAAEHGGVQVAASIEAAVRDAHVVCLCTDSDDPVIRRAWLPAGCHVSSVGSGHEVDADTVAAAKVFVESRAMATQPFPAGSREIAGRDPDSVTEVGEVLLGRRPGRTDDGELTVYKSMGHASEDVAAAAAVFRAALDAGVGTTLDL